MKNDISERSSADLLVEAMSEDGNLRYEAQQLLFKRWRQDQEMGLLIGLLRSEKSMDREFGAFFLDESDPQPTPELLDVVLAMAQDPLPDCRRGFVKYISAWKIYDDTVANSLAMCMHDWHLWVRFAVIDWAVRASDEIFESFSQLIDAGAGIRKSSLTKERGGDLLEGYQKKRGLRGIEIAHRLRAGDDIEEIRKSVAGEDSYSFDRLVFLATSKDRTRASLDKRRAEIRSCPSAHTS